MTTIDDVIKFFNENKDFLPNTYNERIMRKVVELDMITADELLRKLKNKVNKAKNFKEIEEEINNYDIEEETKKLKKNVDNLLKIIGPIPKPTKEELEEEYTSNIQKIKDCDINNGPLEIWFKKHSKTNITQISDALINKLDEFKTIKGARCVIFFKVNGQIKAVTKFLDNEEGFKSVMNILKNPNFELLTEIEQENNNIIECSDTNRDFISGITMDMITGLRFMNKEYQYKKLGLNAVKIYCDNSGSFYHYKINECFKYCKPLLTKLLRYQITNYIKSDIFNMNCLLYALKMSGKVEESTLQKLMIENETRKVNQSALSKIGEICNIKFIVKKIDTNDNKLHDITHNKKTIGSKKEDATIIDLVLIDDHYILNEQVKGINKYALEHYKEIKKYCPNKPDEWILKVSKIKNKRYMIDEQKAHINSYELVRLATSDKIPFKTSELIHMPSCIYDENKTDFDITLFNNYDFKRFKSRKQILLEKYQLKTKPKTKKEKIKPTYFYADTETDTSEGYHKAFCISYKERNEDKIEFIYGDNCLEEFLKVLPDNAVVYFHNLGYDAKMFSFFNITNSIDKGSKTMSQTIKYDGKKITFKDSYSIISMKLKKFPQTFGCR